MGVDFLGDIDIKFYEGQKQGCWSLFQNRLAGFFDRITPLRSDLRQIRVKYDTSIYALFKFFRFLNSFSLFTFFLFLILNVTHLAWFQYSWSDQCAYYIPCVLFYSRYHSNYAVLYSFTFLIFAIVGLFLTLYKWVNFLILKKKADLYINDDFQFSQIFDIWDWRTQKKSDAEDLLKEQTNQVKTSLDEHLIYEKIAKRNYKAKVSILLWRIFLISVNVLVLLGGWSLIILANIYKS